VLLPVLLLSNMTYVSDRAGVAIARVSGTRPDPKDAALSTPGRGGGILYGYD